MSNLSNLKPNSSIIFSINLLHKGPVDKNESKLAPKSWQKNNKQLPTLFFTFPDIALHKKCSFPVRKWFRQ